ncbi:PAS domain-containing protein [Kiloniella antarctica]|uniref:PAS domain-containing protein n=1 Tax=Kiloniella antarctica TaxID=1550907 RepID=A0ABW5BLK8_9PROT
MKQFKTTGRELFFDDDEIIVSKTDLKGKLTYTNPVFIRLAGYSEAELLGKPHNIIRHPDMPRCVFQLLWETLGRGEEIFAYVINKSKNGDHYWVLAHVTPSRNQSGKIIGYHSNRRTPDKKILQSSIIPLYRELVAIENSTSNRKDGMEKSYQKLLSVASSQSMKYDEFIARLAA